MAVLASGDRLRTPYATGPVALCVLLVLTSIGLAQDENTFYSRQPAFRIPFQVDVGDKRVQQVLLHVSEDMGRSYQQIAGANPTERGFTFNARRDGWYYFSVQTRDTEGRLHPASLDALPPGLRVLVDTTPPEVTLRARPATLPNIIGVEWDIRDENLDVGTLRLDYRGNAQDWLPRNIQRVVNGQLSWDPGFTGPVEVRLQVKDKAGNLGETTVTVRGDGASPAPRPTEPLPGATRPENQGGNSGNVRKVNSTKISLNYQVDDVGPSGLSVIEVWLTTNTRDWKLFTRDTSRRPPVQVEVEKEGRYGLTLIAKSGVDLGEQPPRPGDQPQAWVEVDLTKPTVQITDVAVGRGADTGNLTINWQASDKNLSQKPISISYASKPEEGKWTPIPEATGIDNTGRFIWRIPGGVPYEFYLRVEALDEAGNIGDARTATVVKVDLMLPKVRVLGIEPSRP